MINERRYIWTNPLGILWPALAIASLVVGLDLLADGLREEWTAVPVGGRGTRNS